MRTGLTKQEKTTDIWFDEKDPQMNLDFVRSEVGEAVHDGSASLFSSALP